MFKSIVDNSVIVCDKIVNVTNSVSTNVANNMPTNVAITVSTNVRNANQQMSQALCQQIVMIKYKDIKWVGIFCTQFY